MKKRILKSGFTIIMLLFTVSISMGMGARAQFDPEGIFPPGYLGFTATNVALRADPLDANRSILVQKVEFTTPMTQVNQLTITFDNDLNLGAGQPALYFINGIVDKLTLSTMEMTSMNINIEGGIGDNLFYFNYPYNDATTYLLVYISIDTTLDANYINNQMAIFNAIRFVPLAPYDYVKWFETYTEAEIQQMILLSKYTGYTEGYDEGLDDGYDLGIDSLDDEILSAVNTAVGNVHEYGFIAYPPYDDNESYSYDKGYTAGALLVEGESYDLGYLDGSEDSFQANIHKWLVPAIIIVLIAGGFVAFIKMRKSE
ncbi:MAG: hypothetical protein GX660_05730 [Clostridiaceae bacterium]|nr:hypothetical protein [Clostridiaceae bacterium]